MKKVININFQGRVVPIEETAYDLLKQYTESLRNYFADEEGKDEIINDIESRIGELFQERIKNGATCITDDDVNVIINNMGRPQDFADSDDNTKSERTYSETRTEYIHQPTGGKRLYRDTNNRWIGGVCSGIGNYFGIEPIIVRLVFIFSGIGLIAYVLLWAFVPSSDTIQEGVRKRLFRNPDEKIIGGVCSGIASYFNINVWIPRVLFLLPFISFFFRWSHFGPMSFPNFITFTFSPGSFFLYIILWMVIPEASTTSEKLEMKGERVDLGSISSSVKEEMKEVKQRMQKFGKEAKQFAQEKGSTMSAEMGHVTRRSRGTLGNIIIFLAKAFAYVVIGSVALGLMAALVTFGVLAFGLIPIKDFVLDNGWQSFYAWGTLLFFIAIPIIAVITWIIRRIAKIKGRNNLMRYSFLALWLFGIFCFVSLIVSVGRDFKSSSTLVEQEVALANPGVSKLEITASGSRTYYNNGWFHLDPFVNIEDDTAYVANIRLRIVKSNNDSFKVIVRKMSNGRTRHDADVLASMIRFNVSQNDTILTLDKAIEINTTDKFRNQHVIVTVAVPVGKQIKINRNVGYGDFVHFDGPWNDNRWYDEDWDSEEHGWRHGVDYVMKADGLYTLTGKPADRDKYRRNHRDDNGDDWNDDNGDEGNSKNAGGYRYNETKKAADSINKVLEDQRQKSLDSLNKAEEKIRQQKEKLQNPEQPANPNPKQEAFTFPPPQDYQIIREI